MTPCWEGLWVLWRQEENSKNGDVIWIGAGVRYTFRQEWWTAQMWDRECWQLLPGPTFPHRPLSVLQILVAHRVPSAAVVFLAPEFVSAWAHQGSELSWILNSLIGFPYEDLQVTIGQWAGNPATHTEAAQSSSLNPENTCYGFPLHTWATFSHTMSRFHPLVTAICRAAVAEWLQWLSHK